MFKTLGSDNFLSSFALLGKILFSFPTCQPPWHWRQEQLIRLRSFYLKKEKVFEMFWKNLHLALIFLPDKRKGFWKVLKKLTSSFMPFTGKNLELGDWDGMYEKNWCLPWFFSFIFIVWDIFWEHSQFKRIYIINQRITRISPYTTLHCRSGRCGGKSCN